MKGNCALNALSLDPDFHLSADVPGTQLVSKW